MITMYDSSENDVESEVPMIEGAEPFAEIIGGEGVSVMNAGGGIWFITAEQPDDSLVRFAYRLEGANCIVNAGSVFIGVQEFAVAQTTKVLAAATEYIYIKLNTNLASAASIEQSTTDPGAGDSSEYRWRLVQYEAVAVGKYKVVAHYRKAGGDVVVHLPQR